MKQPIEQPALSENAVDTQIPVSATSKRKRKKRGQLRPQELRGHTGRIFSLLALKNHTLWSGLADTTIRVWQEGGGNYHCAQTLSGHTDTVLSLAELPNDTVASGSADGTIRLWRKENGGYRCIQRLTDDLMGRVFSLLALGDGTLVSGATDGGIRVWREENESYRCLQGVSGYEHYVNGLTGLPNMDSAASIAVLPSGWLASGSEDGTIRLVKAKRSKKPKTAAPSSELLPSDPQSHEQKVKELEAQIAEMQRKVDETAAILARSSSTSTAPQMALFRNEGQTTPPQSAENTSAKGLGL